MLNIKLLSLVVPAYKQENTIAKDLNNLESVLSNLPFNYEIVIVVDGFVDKTYENVKKIKSRKIKVLGYEANQGKGHAVKLGMLKAKGDVVGFIDAGMDIDATGIAILLDLLVWKNADVIVGSKLHKESKVNYPMIRKILTWGYRHLTHLLFGFNVKDTQAGIKFFRREVVRAVFPKIIVKAFAFDVEVLAVASSLGFTRIYEGPIRLNFNNDSSITSRSFWKIIFLMLWDTFAVFYRLKITKSYAK
ncbi:MAG: glycosyltransferase [Candidatus Levybacteria bacterium]|nr:glycosyltransferase [Candidatus Levybacteria bacterium]